MRIAIINLTSQGISGGYKKYLLNILSYLENDALIDKIICALPYVIIEKISVMFKKVEFVEIPNYHILLNNSLHRRIYSILDIYKPDLVFVPVERPLNYDHAPVITMLQNMEPFICPFQENPQREKIKNLLRYITGYMAMRKADRIIAISEFVRQYLINQIGIDPAKIGLVYHGIDKPSDKTKTPEGVPVELKSFLFTAGSIRPARGLEDIIEALGILANKGERIPLIIAGNVEKTMIGYQKRLQNLAQKYAVSELVHWIGHLDEEEMSWCFSNCSVFIMSSRVESFGLTAGEAMAHGAVCISADNPCLPEIFGDAAVYYPPKNHRALAERILEVTSWPEEKRREMSERAKKRASQFSWDICAQKTIEQFQIAIEEFKARKTRKG